MEDKLVTLAIHTFEKAHILKTILEAEGIEVFIHSVNEGQPAISAGVRVRIKEGDLPRALRIIEATQFFAENQSGFVGRIAKKILIPVDFSDYSMRACETGFEYAAQTGAEIMLVHAYYNALIPPSLHYFGIGESRGEATAGSSGFGFGFGNGRGFTHSHDDDYAAYDRAESDMKNMTSVIDKKIASGEWSEVKYNYTLRKGLPEDEIIACAKEYRPMLIIMGTRGKNRKNTEMIGSVTAEIIEHTKVPLLAIPENVTFKSIKEANNIAFATSFNQQDLVTFDHFTELIKGYSPVIHLFNISTSHDEWNEIRLTGTREYLQKHYPELTVEYSVLDDGDLFDAIGKFTLKKQIDIITLTAYRRSMMPRMFNLSIARRALFHTNTALLVIPKI